MKKNLIMRAAILLLVLTVAATSLSLAFTSARFSTSNIMSNEFAVYHLISFERTGYGWGTAGIDGTGSSHTTFNNAPAGEWAFFARGVHGGAGIGGGGRPGIFMGIYNKTTAGHFRAGVIRGGDNNGGEGGVGGHLAYIMSNMDIPPTVPATNASTANWVAIAGGGGGGGAHANYHGGHAGGQGGTVANPTWNYLNGVVTPSPAGWADAGFIGGWRGQGGSGQNRAQTTDAANRAGGGGGAGISVANRRAGGSGATGTGTSPNGTAGGWLSGGTGGGGSAWSTGGGGAGVWGGGGGAGGLTVSSGPGGGGSSFSGASASVPAAVANPETYREHAISLFWNLVGNAHTDTGRNYDGKIILVWLGP